MIENQSEVVATDKPMAKKVQRPTVGRIVSFHEEYATMESPKLAAIIVFVHDITLVNLTVFTTSGTPYGVLNVPLIQDGESVPPHTNKFCTWPSKV